jgi:hypothetical protein
VNPARYHNYRSLIAPPTIRDNREIPAAHLFCFLPPQKLDLKKQWKSARESRGPGPLLPKRNLNFCGFAASFFLRQVSGGEGFVLVSKKALSEKISICAAPPSIPPTRNRKFLSFPLAFRVERF